VASIATAVVLAGVAGTVLVLRDRRSSPVIALGAPSNSASTVTPSPSPTPDSSFASWFASESSGVIRIQATSCGQSDIGTGFLIAPDLVATVNHVVAAPVTVALSAGGETTTGVVVGSDPSGDLALVRAARPFAGHVFSLASSPPQVGAAVAAMGYPENLPLTMTQGAISGLDRTITLDGRSLGGLIQTDTPVNPGNSGGPLIDASGTVVGLVDAKLLQAEGIGYAISSGPASQAFASWEQSGAPEPPASCSAPVGPPGAGDVLTQPTDPDALGVATTLSTYYNAINAAHYRTAWEQLTPTERTRISLSHLASADSTSFIFSPRLRSLTRTSAGTIVAFVTFTSIQAPGYGPNGESCDHWTLDYTMRLVGFRWLIDLAGPHNGSTHSTC